MGKIRSSKTDEVYFLEDNHMKITFPHMGNAYIAVKVLLDGLGLDYYMPAVSDRKALVSGIENSPEFMCFPFKTILANFIDGLNNGADTILFGGGCGQCRLSYYGDLHQEILHSMGYSFNYIDLALNHLTYKEVMTKFGPFIKDKSKAVVVRAVTNSAWTVFAVDGVYSKAGFVRCREVHKGDADRVMQRFEACVSIVRDFRSIRDAIIKAKRELCAIELIPQSNPIKIGIIGEIFIASEPMANLEIEKKLGNMGVQVVNSMSVSMWIRHHFIDALLPIHRKDPAIEAAQAYMKTDDVGGHGVNTVGNAELMSRKGYDGIVHIYPFTCMPEIIAQCAFSEIEKKHGIPIMTLIVDEMTGEAGYVTRLEAFVDMIEMRREANVKAAAIPVKM
jgi:predicted nucleotide-binding protein (sugar kinase/HSP70/actin superfamily)